MNKKKTKDTVRDLIPLLLTTGIPIIMSVWLLITGHEEENNIMGIGEVIAIVVVLIGVASGIWAQVIQFKKDAQRIDSVKETSAAIKEDTICIKPGVERIENTTEKIHEGMISQVIPNMSKLDGIDMLLDDVKYRKWVEEKTSATQSNPTYVISAVQNIYNENVRLKEELHKTQALNNELLNENNRLNALYTLLKAKTDVQDKDYESDY